MIVADSTVFISLAKIGRLQTLRQVYELVFMPQSVKQETIDSGREVKAPEVTQIEIGISQGWIEVVLPTLEENELTQRIREATLLDRGESEALALAMARNLPLILDDREARKVAEAYGIEYTGTVGVVLQAYIRGYMDFDQFIESMRDLSNVLWLSPAIVADALRLAREARQ